jgi:pyruvate/2-oxoglutarate dehydrogenase complex dihydrolipoamide acyltransferase (E2) component
MNILQKITTPQESVNDDSLLVIKIHVTEGQEVLEGALLAEFESSKAIIEIHSDVKGFVSIKCNEGEEVGVGKVIFEIADSVSILSNVASIKPLKSETENKDTIQLKETVFSEKANKLISEKNLKKEDFFQYDFVNENIVKQKLGIVAEVPARKKENPKQNPINISTEIIEGSVKTDPIKKREIDFLSSVNSSGLVSNLATQILCEGFDQKIAKFQQIIISTPLPLVIFECSRILPKFKNLNSYFIDYNVVFHSEINIGFAVDLGKGLKVLNIRNANQKSLEEIETEILRLVDAYNDDTLDKNDLTGITFTISDLFISVVSNFLPLVNKNNSAILGISAPDASNKYFNVSCSFDHRVSNGREVSEFLAVLKSRLDIYLNNGSSLN